MSSYPKRRRCEYRYDVPEGAFFASTTKYDHKLSTISIGGGYAGATLTWIKSTQTAHVNVWTKGKLSWEDRLSWTAYAWMPCEGDY